MMKDICAKSRVYVVVVGGGGWQETGEGARASEVETGGGKNHTLAYLVGYPKEVKRKSCLAQRELTKLTILSLLRHR